MSSTKYIEKNDYTRVLLTETLPYETPIIFSNDGLYERIKCINDFPEFEKKLIRLIIYGEKPTVSKKSKQIKPTKPYLYKICKDSVNFRRLALLHPISQHQIKLFYEKYASLILHYCSISPASIRSPKGIASTFYTKGLWENLYQYKENQVSSVEKDALVKHMPSFFSYNGYDRLYKFFNSSEYFSLEKRFRVQMSLDVSKCFDSIYTHSITWATKDKAFTKDNLNRNSFGDAFDTLIRHGNDNETNGIPIGPEVSRVFSEIIFQKIDLLTIEKLKSEGIDLKFDINYVFKRYVDDVYIFADNQEIAEKIYAIYSDSLVSFNLHTNVSKSSITTRPFASSKSRLIHEISNLSNNFFDKFLEIDGLRKLKPKKIYRSSRLAKSFIESIKVLCVHNNVGYDEVSSFVISSLTNRVKRLIDTHEVLNEEKSNYYHVLKTILEVAFFLYEVAPSVGASYKLSTMIIFIIRFCRHYSLYEEEIALKIFGLTNDLMLNESNRKQSISLEGFIHLEFLNILLAVRELGDLYLLPEITLKKLFLDQAELSYFTVTSCLFYIKDDSKYDTIRLALINYINQKLSNLEDITINSEKAYLLLDILSCPYIPNSDRERLVQAVAFLLKISLNNSEISNLSHSFKSQCWHTDWSNVDLLNLLEKKELKQSYS